ncbi:hypothetical protein KKP97_00090 [Methanothermococcus sp. SCGC AD-155-C09]|nr:hypothetical protein [Methanothermococcus sp. SCGC AD-155-C09]
MDKIKCPFCESKDLRFKREIISQLNNKKLSIPAVIFLRTMDIINPDHLLVVLKKRG